MELKFQRHYPDTQKHVFQVKTSKKEQRLYHESVWTWSLQGRKDSLCYQKHQELTGEEKMKA